MHTFTLTIHKSEKRATHWKVNAQFANKGVSLGSAEEAVGYELVVNSGDGEVCQNADLAKLSNDILAYGTFLGEKIFHGSVGKLFRDARNEVPGLLHFIIVLGDPSLEVIGWQCLCGEFDGGWAHLRFHLDTPFAVHVDSSFNQLVTEFDRRETRALILIAGPSPNNSYNLKAFDVARTARGIKSALGSVPSTVLASISADGPPTTDALRQVLVTKRIDWLHLVCHGRKLQGTVLYLLDENANVAPVSANAFIGLLNQTGSRGSKPRFAFICACESAKENSDQAIRDLARQLIRDAGFAAVVAMTESISVETATRLSETFYFHLAFHGLVDLALNAACVELAERNDILVPTLFSRLNGSSLFAEADFLDFDQVTSDWGEWASEQLSPELLTVDSSVDSPLLREWEDFLAAPSFQTAVQDLVDNIATEMRGGATGELKSAVDNLCAVNFNQSCEKLRSAILSPLKECVKARVNSPSKHQKSRSEIDYLASLQSLVGARAFRCCFPVVGQFGNGKSYFVRQVVASSIAGNLRPHLVLPLKGRIDNLPQAILSAANLAARRSRSWRTIEELDSDLGWHNALLVIVIDDLHDVLDIGNGEMTHAVLEDFIRQSSRFRSIRWLFTIQDTRFDKVAYRDDFWREYGITAGYRSDFYTNYPPRRAPKAESLSSNDGDYLIGWIPLNDRVLQLTTGIEILQEHLQVSDELLDADPNSSQKRHLAIPLIAAIIVSEGSVPDRSGGLSVNRASLVKRLLDILYAKHGGAELAALFADSIEALSRIFLLKEKPHMLSDVNRILEKSNRKPDFISAKLVELGLIGMDSADFTATSDMVKVTYLFDPIWHCFHARTLLKHLQASPCAYGEWLDRFSEQLGAIVNPDHREGVAEFSLAMQFRETAGLPENSAARAAAEFAAHPDLPGAAAFRAASYEEREFLIEFARIFRKKHQKELDEGADSRRLFNMLMFVDDATELPLPSATALLANRYSAFQRIGYSGLCATVLARRILSNSRSEDIWSSLHHLAGVEVLFGESHQIPDLNADEVFRRNYAFELADIAIDQIRGCDEIEGSFMQLLAYLKRERGRAEKDHADGQPRRTPYFFRQCVLYHFCDWFLGEYSLKAMNELARNKWYWADAEDQFGRYIAMEMEQEVNKAFGRWYRRNRFDHGQADYRILLQEMVDSGDIDKTVTAYFMMRHTVISNAHKRTHYVDAEFTALLDQFRRLGKTIPEFGEKLRQYPVALFQQKSERK